MTRKLCIDPYTPEELKDALRDQSNSPIVNWTGEYGIMHQAYLRIVQLERRIDQLENEVNAVEWVNGRMERELEAALRKCG